MNSSVQNKKTPLTARERGTKLTHLVDEGWLLTGPEQTETFIVKGRTLTLEEFEFAPESYVRALLIAHIGNTHRTHSND